MTQARRPCLLVCRSERHPVVFDRVYILYISRQKSNGFHSLPSLQNKSAGCFLYYSCLCIFQYLKDLFLQCSGSVSSQKRMQKYGVFAKLPNVFEKSFNFRRILTDVYTLSTNLTPFTLLYFTKEESKLMTQEREIKQAKMDENYTLMANFKDRWQNLKVFVFKRKKTANWFHRISFQINFYGVIKSKSN